MTQDHKPYLLFSLNKEHFGISVENVLRVISFEKLIAIPKAPDFIAGAISLEGNVIPVVDLAIKIELGETHVSSTTKVIILEVQHEDETIETGVLIDEVLDVVNIDESKLIPPALDRMGFNSQTLDGIYKVEENFYMILNAEKIFEQELARLV